MANPTTNFGWVMPTSTSLVTNLPADFNTFGQGVDTSMAQLKGGTTGQILSKTSATDMAFTWVTPTDQTPLTTKGDLFTFTTVDARLGVGTNGYILSANSATATGLEWIAANPGDITGVTAGTGISGGGTSGDVTVTNSMATAMTTKGDLVPATGSGAFARLGVGANDTVLTADSTAATGMKWATAGTAFVGCSVTRTNTSTAMTSGAAAVVAFTAENYDTNSFHDNTTNNSRITIPTGKGGKYYVNAMFNNALGAVGSYAIIYIYLNGSQITQGYREGHIWRGNGDPIGNASAVLTLAAGDYIEMYYQQGNTETVNMWFIMSATYLGA